ncbi:MAG TPA: magnesium-translocating P-type ATPase [Kofleriaceae bacterium]|nr:magnesium-translocating P-type ATPase [Kofleriaceae bacterium]
MSYWTQAPAEVARSLGVGLDGLRSDDAARRLARFGPNEIRARRRTTRWHVVWRQIRSPLVLLLVFAAIASAITGQWIDAAIVGAILAASVGIGYHREYRAEAAIGALLERIQITAEVVRDGQPTTIPVRDVVPGDVIVLSAGSIVPADAILVEATELHVDDAVLTGESFPSAKRVGPVAAGAALRDRTGCVQFGTNVRSGTARALVVETGPRTAFGAIAGRLASRAPETEFERGLRRFGVLLLVAMLVMIVVVFALNVLLGRPVIDTLLFAIALAVGLSPELLPAIVGVNLSRAAQTLASEGVLVRRLDAIEDLGSMQVLCTDKTGTLTEGVVRVSGAYDVRGEPSPDVMTLAVLNAGLQAGLANPIDAALLAAQPMQGRADKLAEVPYDFTRKRLSVIVRRGADLSIITKGAFDHVLEVCARAGGAPLDDARRAELAARYERWSSEGIRVIAVAARALPAQASYGIADERDLDLAGFITLMDQPKADAAATVASLRGLGVRVKMITGDSRLVARHVADEVGLRDTKLLVGADLHDLTDIALVRAAIETDVFAEVDPNQKERILRALRRGGAVVGFFGDGVNDAPAMHAADVSISVETAVDVAKSTADLVLTRKGLDVIHAGIEHGRTTFANTLKYILTTTSANLGNMISMAVASVVLPFLPLTAGQVLLNNFLSDVPAVGIASDRVDPELVAGPRRWDTRFIGRFMLEFGLLSSLFDALTFVVLVVGFRAAPAEFRTAWFVESLFTELVIALVVRTRRPAWRSRPGSVLVWTTLVVAVVAFAMPYLPYVGVLGFTQPPAAIMLAIVAITAGYVIASELLKTWFYRNGNALPVTPTSRAAMPPAAGHTTRADRAAPMATA